MIQYFQGKAFIMRNFTIAFMILILFLSITFAIFKPMPAQNNAQNDEFKEKTYVEKLITEPNATHNENREFYQTNFEKTSNYNEISSQEINREISQNENNLQKNEFLQPKNLPQSEAINSKTEKRERMQQQRANRRNYENISKELSDKYNNDPNAVVSEEDFNYFIKKTIEQSKQENY